LFITLSIFIAAFVALNLFAFVHGRAMTHFTAGGSKTAAPETLDFAGKLRVLFCGVSIPRPLNTSTPNDFGMNFKTIQLNGREQLPLELWDIEKEERKGTVLLFPGYATAKDSLLPAAKVFNQLGYGCVLLDFRGCGGSGGMSTGIGCKEADDARRAVQYATENKLATPLILYAGSMGAAAVLRALSLGQISPAGLILECPFDRLSTTVKHRFRAMGVPSFPLADLLLLWGGIQMGFNAFAHNPATYAKAVRCPVLLMHGECDPRVTLDEVRRVYDAIPARKDLKLFSRLGHELYVTTSPDVWRQSVERFLNTLGK
jgi:alpha-beta hydrolase superfamily lysophospholipase